MGFGEYIRGGELLYASKEEKENKNFVIKAILFDSDNFKHASEKFRGDIDVVAAAISKDARMIKFATAEIINNEASVCSLVGINPFCLVLLKHFQSNPRVVFAAIQKDGKILNHVDPEFRNDKNFILEAVKTAPEIFQNIPAKVKILPIFILKAIENNPEVFKYLDDDLKNSHVFARKAIENGFEETLLYAGEEVRNDKQVLACAVRRFGIDQLKCVGLEVLKDEEFIASLEKEYKKDEEGRS